MKLSSIIKKSPKGDEITVWDDTYDIEVYFYNQENDAWDRAMMDLASKLNVVDMHNGGVTVDLYELIERNIPALEASGLFKICDTDVIMDDIESILAGYVSEDWLCEFVDCLR